jgi:hypothetical protein
LRGVSGLLGPIIYTLALATFISPGAPFVLPGAPFVLSATLLGLSLLIGLAMLKRAAKNPAVS